MWNRLCARHGGARRRAHTQHKNRSARVVTRETREICNEHRVKGEKDQVENGVRASVAQRAVREMQMRAQTTQKAENEGRTGVDGRQWKDTTKTEICSRAIRQSVLEKKRSHTHASHTVSQS